MHSWCTIVQLNQDIFQVGVPVTDTHANPPAVSGSSKRDNIGKGSKKDLFIIILDWVEKYFKHDKDDGEKLQ